MRQVAPFLCLKASSLCTVQTVPHGHAFPISAMFPFQSGRIALKMVTMPVGGLIAYFIAGRRMSGTPWPLPEVEEVDLKGRCCFSAVIETNLNIAAMHKQGRKRFARRLLSSGVCSPKFLCG
ncbi:hypothetical protein EDD17DRAFT_1557154 [Pisolithus thermaeus]|nr:hypothetical protein EDD17DRAFT_1557154 [Pisolithus thermaeus]